MLLESEEALLKMSVSQPESGMTSLPDFSSMTEEEQIAYAMQMSLAGGGWLAIFEEITCFITTWEKGEQKKTEKRKPTVFIKSIRVFFL